MAEIMCGRCGSGEYTTSKSGQHLKASCAKCGTYIKFLSQGNEVKIMTFGKFKDTAISHIFDKNYLEWILRSDKIKDNLRLALDKRLKEIS